MKIRVSYTKKKLTCMLVESQEVTRGNMAETLWEVT